MPSPTAGPQPIALLFYLLYISSFRWMEAPMLSYCPCLTHSHIHTPTHSCCPLRYCNYSMLLCPCYSMLQVQMQHILEVLCEFKGEFLLLLPFHTHSLAILAITPSTDEETFQQENLNVSGGCFMRAPKCLISASLSAVCMQSRGRGRESTTVFQELQRVSGV